MQQDPQAPSHEEEVLMNHYKIIKTLGTGNFAQVKLALHLHTEVQVALKTLEKDKKNASLIANELEIMKILDHPNITKLFHVMETTEHIYMVLEYASGGDLAGRILEVDYMKEGEARHIFAQMVCAINYCHENGIAHRDIKPENILMDAHRNIKLCDFGLAIKVTTEQKSTVFCGTLPYCAPELFSCQGYDPRALDIWSMGVVLYIMVTKHYPFKATTYEKMKEEMQEPHYYIPPKLPAHIANLIVRLFTIDPGQRPKIRDIMEHQWLKGSEEFSKLTQFLETLPNKPNPNIMAAMWGMGYNPKDIRDSLHEKKFNSIMATYLILKHQSPWVDNINHTFKLMQPSIAMEPSDSSTFHLFLKKTGNETDHSTSTLPAKFQSHDNDDELVRKEDSKNLSMPAILCCQHKSLPHPTGTQCGPVQHTHEQLLSSSLQKRSRSSKSVSCSPVQHDHDEQLLSGSLQKRSRSSKSVSCGPVQHDHKRLLSSILQKRIRVSKSVSCSPVQHDHDEQLLSSTLQKKSMASKSVSYGPVQHDHEQLLSSTLQKKSMASKSVSCGPVQHEQLLSGSLQKSTTASKSVSYGPVQHDSEQLLSSSLQKRRSMASKSVSCSPEQHDHEQLLSSSLQKKSMASKSVSYGPVQHEQLLSGSLQKRIRVSKSVSCSPEQHDHEQLLSSSLQKKSMASKSVSCGPVQHEQLLSGSLQKRIRVSKSVSYGPVQHDSEQLLSSSLQESSTVSKSVSCSPEQHDMSAGAAARHDHDEQLLSSSLQKSSTASKSVSYGPVQHDSEQLLSSSACRRRDHASAEEAPGAEAVLQKRSMASKSVSCGPVQHDHEQLLSSILQKKSTASKSVSCGPEQHEQLLSSSLQKKNRASKSVSCGS
ncbi:sperm motility kinase X-like [Peromyscus leucopus]|uniref:sperm motility kinase X-like n=1 Tax=Peromyscus leucopus TaxID=10041 RepID=UPI0010A175F1|nr:sperm motility kinase X-like [Peromyscus leucopus]